MLYFTIIYVFCAAVVPAGVTLSNKSPENFKEITTKNLATNVRIKNSSECNDKQIFRISSIFENKTVTFDFLEDLKRSVKRMKGFETNLRFTSRKLLSLNSANNKKRRKRRRKEIVLNNLRFRSNIPLKSINSYDRDDQALNLINDRWRKFSSSYESSNRNLRNIQENLNRKNRLWKRASLFLDINNKIRRQNIESTTAEYESVFAKKMKEFREYREKAMLGGVTTAATKPKPDLLKPDLPKPDLLKSDLPKPDLLKPDIPKSDLTKSDDNFHRNSLPDPCSSINASHPSVPVKQIPLPHELPNNKILTTDRYLSIRHSLRNYLSRTNAWNKAHGAKKCRRRREDMTNCTEVEEKKKPPLICIPFIKEGQDKILKEAISKLQKMLDKRHKKSTTERTDIFGQIKYKPKNKKLKHDNSKLIDTNTEPFFTAATFTLSTTETTPDFKFEPVTNANAEYTTFEPIPTCPPFLSPPEPFTPPEEEDVATFPICPPSTSTTIQITFPPWPTIPNLPKPDPCGKAKEPPIIYCPDKIDWESTTPFPAECLTTTTTTTTTPATTTTTSTTTTTTSTTTTTTQPPPICPPCPPPPCPPECEEVTEEPTTKDVCTTESTTTEDDSCEEDSTTEDITVDDDDDDDDEILYDYDIEVETSPPAKPRKCGKPKKCKKSKKKKKNQRRHKRDNGSSFQSTTVKGSDVHDALRSMMNNMVSPSKTNLTNITETTTWKNTTVSVVKTSTTEETQDFTTMKGASLVKGPKKVMSRPIPKVFPRIFPSSVSNVNNTRFNVSDITYNNGISSIDDSFIPEIPTNSHLQLLAVCEGFLEVVKLIKSHNESFNEEPDAELIHYCESIISKSFNFSNNVSKENLQTPTTKESVRKRSASFIEKQLHDKVLVDILRSPVYKRQLKDFKEYFLKKNEKQRILNRRSDLVHLLRKKKRALLSSIHNSTEKTSANIIRKDTTQKIDPGVTSYPIYASRYDYNKGGKVREIDVLWRQFNKKNHRREIVKNVTVLALMANPNNLQVMDRNDVKVAEDNDNDSDDDEMINNSSINHDKSTVDEEFEKDENSTEHNTTSTTPLISTTVSQSNATSNSSNLKTFVKKPDPSSILGNPPVKEPKPSKTTKAKEIFQQYMIEFLNYAVYIIPIMFLSLFVVCCLCCFIKLFPRKKKKKKRKRSRKYSDTTSDESTSATEPKIRQTRFDSLDKKLDDIIRILNEKGNAKSVWSESGINGGEEEKEKMSTKKKKFLRFLHGKKKGKKLNNVRYTSLDSIEESPEKSDMKMAEVTDSDPNTSDSEGKKEEDEAKERKELIALLKKFDQLNGEPENGKKEEEKKTSVVVQYVTEGTDPDLEIDRNHELQRYSPEISNYSTKNERGWTYKNSYYNPEYPIPFQKFRRVSEEMTNEPSRNWPNERNNKNIDLDGNFRGFPPPRRKPQENTENIRHQGKKFVHLTDSGVLCRM